MAVNAIVYPMIIERRTRKVVYQFLTRSAAFASPIVEFGAWEPMCKADNIHDALTQIDRSNKIDYTYRISR